MLIFMLVLAMLALVAIGGYAYVDPLLLDYVQAPEGEEDGHVDAVTQGRPPHHQSGVSHVKGAFGADERDVAILVSHSNCLLLLVGHPDPPHLSGLRSTGRARATRPVRYVLLDAPFRLAQAGDACHFLGRSLREQGKEFLGRNTGTRRDLPQRG